MEIDSFCLFPSSFIIFRTSNVAHRPRTGVAPYEIMYRMIEFV